LQRFDGICRITALFKGVVDLSIARKILWILITQIALIAIFGVSTVYALRVEILMLNLWYVLGAVAGVLFLLDFIILLFICRSEVELEVKQPSQVNGGEHNG
jgi:uncharacterized membrane protein